MRVRILLLLFFFLITGSIYAAGLEAPPTPKFEKPPAPSAEQSKTPPATGNTQNEMSASPAENTGSVPLLSHPPTVQLKVKPPKTEAEAFKRIKDYKIFKQILPPGAAPPHMEKRFFGKYLEKVKPYIENSDQENLDEIINEEPPAPVESTNSAISKGKTNNSKLNNHTKRAVLNNKAPSTRVKINIKNVQISDKLKQEILKKYTINYSEPKKHTNNTFIPLNKKRYPSFQFAIFLTIIWAGILGVIVYRRSL
jgi:hypothetical protein